jgi:hypothetical protein
MGAKGSVGAALNTSLVRNGPSAPRSMAARRAGRLAPGTRTAAAGAAAASGALAQGGAGEGVAAWIAGAGDEKLTAAAIMGNGTTMKHTKTVTHEK